MNDSPELARRDAAITTLYYKEGVFRQFFTSPFDQYADRIGQPFEVVKQIQQSELETEESDAKDDMYLVRFPDGNEIEAFGHEVCVLEYEKCYPLFENVP